ncbi:hypothetical protein RHMOL_Rhmol12G0063600 [Rhododendron molle]|uniref:Uncharacterized protein n=1 Tax=Rhododendron molle TaxID=49168 RepID=A0ACC0LG45_RHOML|nr:hypothetical protein RHMOL_Rhmol12G0063600 [Rhododendron molle]
MSSSSIWFSVGVFVPQWRLNKTFRFWVFLHSKRYSSSISFVPSPISSSLSDDSSPLPPNKIQVGYDPSEDLFGLAVDLQPRNLSADLPKPRSWFGPNGQYIRELPCPSCRGRGYTQCTECGIERPRLDCSHCNGKGGKTCHRCLGERVIWEESIDEQPWEKARSVSPFKVKEDDEVDNLDLKLDAKRKSKRVYQSPPPEVGLKISRSLKLPCLVGWFQSLNAKTGLFSNRMKIIHQDPMLHAQRVAAIKKAKRTEEARKQASESMKAFFRDPENRLRRSVAMKGVKYYCTNCGREGHRRHYCPELQDTIDRRFSCQLCGEKGHNRRTCSKSNSAESKTKVPRNNICSACGQSRHNRRTCPLSTGQKAYVADTMKVVDSPQSRIYTCRMCLGKGHNSRTCPSRSNPLIEKSET